MNKIQISLLLFLLSFKINAQQPLNLDFENLSVEGFKRPWGWSPQTWGADFVLDSTTVKSGTYSLYSKCLQKESQCTQQSIAFNIEPYQLLGKEISISGHIKGKKLTKAITVSIEYTQFNEESGEYIFKEVESERLSGTFSWKNVSLYLRLPQNTTQIRFIINQEGMGEAWFDNFTLKIDGEVVSEIKSAKAFLEKNINWLQKNAYSFNSPLPVLDENTFPKEDLSFFKKTIGNSKIIALGESTHGTSEFFSLKHKLLQYAVTELGFRVFILEDHLMAGEDINAFVTQGKGTLESATKWIFGTWQKVEVHKMIQWIRDYNKMHPNDMIYFAGVDVQEITRPIDSLTNFIKKQDDKLYNKHFSTLKKLKEKGKNHHIERDSLVRLSWINESENIYKEILSKKVKWLQLAKSKSEELNIEYGIQYANIVQQYFKEIYSFGRALYRDEAMAENTSWYFETIYPNKKMLIWAHDSHVSKGGHKGQFTNFNNGISMGFFLSKKYKSNYKSFGLATYEGDFLAFKTYAYKEQVKAPLFPSPKGSIEEALHQISKRTGENNLYINLSKSTEWLNKPLPIRFANHVSIDYGYWLRLVVPYQFDGLFFIDKTSSAKKINP